AAGRAADAVKIVVWAACHCGDDPRLSFDAVKYNVARAILRDVPGMADDVTRATAEKIRRHYDYEQHGDARADFAKLVPDELVPRFAFAGTPHEVAAQIAALRSLGVDEVALAIPAAPEFGGRNAVVEKLAPMLVPETAHG
ncbi:MAG: LLM class flavin-dependent oxidoreductase, partial [Alphaproteobacteria bacterium]|nr:LLM class flavin-dependent oxidoreductase [Alphaproteobacteria bacterium]